MNDEEQHGDIVNFMFWFFLIVLAVAGVILLGGPG